MKIPSVYLSSCELFTTKKSIIIRFDQKVLNYAFISVKTVSNSYFVYGLYEVCI